jgi:NADPH-dependent 2,4-dienoyl-CoA reductase/sulfur reductase-like enzyme
MRFIDEIIDMIRDTLGPNYPISVRICGDEFTPDIPDTLNLDDGLAIGKHLEGKGIDVLDVSNGSGLNGNANCDSYSYTPGWKKHVAKAFKEQLSIPIIATNTIKTPEFAEQLLEEGVSDFVGLGRSQFADPMFMKKAKEGRSDEIRTCIGCMVCRERLFVHRNSLACALNPRMGREYILGDVKKDGDGRPVAVIGGGPGGMQAAVVLAERGFKVTLFEKENELGGTLKLADKPPHKDLIENLIASLARQMEVLGVDVKLGTAATPEMVKKLSPAGVFVAGGAQPIIPNMPGIDGANVVTAESVVRGDVKLTGKVVVVGTGMTGLETAEMLGEAGCELTLVEMVDTVGPGLFAVILNELMERIDAFSPTILTSHKLLSVSSNGVELEKMADGSKVSVDADHVVLALGVKPVAGVVEAYEAEFMNVFAIGDARKGGRIYDTMKDGYNTAFVFEP